MLTEDYITEVYCFIDDMMKECWKNIRKRGPGPKLSDAEVITMEIAGESLGMDCDKTIHRYFRDHWLHLFPNLGTRTTFLRQAANLWRVKQEIRRILLTRLLPNGSQISIVDGFPMPVCGFRRAHFSKLFNYNLNGFFVKKLAHGVNSPAFVGTIYLSGQALWHGTADAVG